MIKIIIKIILPRVFKNILIYSGIVIAINIKLITFESKKSLLIKLQRLFNRKTALIFK